MASIAIASITAITWALIVVTGLRVACSSSIDDSEAHCSDPHSECDSNDGFAALQLTEPNKKHLDLLSRPCSTTPPLVVSLCSSYTSLSDCMGAGNCWAFQVPRQGSDYPPIFVRCIPNANDCATHGNNLKDIAEDPRFKPFATVQNFQWNCHMKDGCDSSGKQWSDVTCDEGSQLLNKECNCSYECGRGHRGNCAADLFCNTQKMCSNGQHNRLCTLAACRDKNSSNTGEQYCGYGQAPDCAEDLYCAGRAWGQLYPITPKCQDGRKKDMCTRKYNLTQCQHDLKCWNLSPFEPERCDDDGRRRRKS